MAHYAFVDLENVVVDVIVGNDEGENIAGITNWEQYYSFRKGLRCLRTSYNTHAGNHLSGGEAFRGNYAAVGFQYRDDLDAFIPPQPAPTDDVAEWVLDEATFSWVPVEA